MLARSLLPTGVVDWEIASSAPTGIVSMHPRSVGACPRRSVGDVYFEPLALPSGSLHFILPLTRKRVPGNKFFVLYNLSLSERGDFYAEES